MTNTNLVFFYKIRYWNFLILITLIFFKSGCLYSDDKFGLTIGGSYNRHLVNFSHLPEIPSCCPNYSSGEGYGIFGSIFYSLSISELFSINTEFGLQSSKSMFRFDEIKPVRVGNEVEDGIFAHSIDLGKNSIYLSTAAYLNLIENLRFGTGFWFAHSYSGTVVQKEQILKPDGIIYENGRRIRDEYSGKIPDFIPFRLAFTLNIDYELPFSILSRFQLIPRFSYYYDMIPLIKYYNWSTHYINLSLSLYYKPEKISPEFHKETIIVVDTLIQKDKNLKDSLFVVGKTFTNIITSEKNNIIFTEEIIKRTDTLLVPEKTDLYAKIQTFAVYPDESRKKIFSIKVIENYVRSVVPLLSYIFFEHNSSEISEKYKNKEDYTEETDFIDPVLLNRNIFSIIAQRIKENPQTKIKLFGFSDKTTEKSDCRIARDRAIAVRDYFVKNFSIDSSVFTIITSNKNCDPRNPTLSQNEDGFFENRRVEIEPDDPQLLKPISIISRLNAPFVDPPILEFNPDGTSSENIKDWKLEVFQNGKILLKYYGKGIPQKIIQHVDSVLAEQIKSSETLNVRLTVWNHAGDSAVSYDNQIVDTDTSDKILERYSVALFKVSKDILRDVDKLGIQEFSDKINNGDTITITGFTDYLGSPAENLKLSQNRADAVYQFLNKILKDKKLKVIIDKCEGVADKIMPSNIQSYSTPEERYLSRTVQIEIKKAK